MDSENTVFVPTTLGYKRNRLQEQSRMLVLSSVLMVVVVAFSIWVIFISKWGVFDRILYGVIGYLGMFMVVRYLIIGERRISKYYSKVLSQDFKIDAKDFWGIFSIDTVEPYICRFRSGNMGVFVAFNKDVLVGKGKEVYRNHSDALTEALRYAHNSKIRMIHVDYMSSKGEDDRIPQLYADLNNCESEDLKDFCVQVYSNLEESLSDTQSVYDVYMFSYRGSENKFFDALDTLISLFMEANYVSYKFMGAQDIRQLAEDIFNLEDFSVVEARREAFSTYKKGDKGQSTVIPIAVTNGGREIILNKTVSQKKEEARLKEEHIKALAEEKKRRRSRTGRHAAPEIQGGTTENKSWLDEEIKL